MLDRPFGFLQSRVKKKKGRERSGDRRLSSRGGFFLDTLEERVEGATVVCKGRGWERQGAF